MSGFEELIALSDVNTADEVVPVIPSRRLESWKYMPTRTLTRTNWARAEVKESSQFAVSGGSFLNSPAALSVDTGLTDDEVSRIESFKTAHGFNSIHHALQGACCVLVCKASSETKLELNRLANQANSAGFASLIIRLQSNAQLTLIEQFESTYVEAQNLDGLAIFITAERDARMTHIRFQQSNDHAHTFTALDVRLLNNSRYNLTSFDFGAKLARSDIHIRLSQEFSEARVNGLALTNISQYHDTHIAIDHEVPDTKSAMIFRNMVNGKGQATFNGRVLIKPNAQRSSTEQSIANLLLSEKGRVNPKPELEIYADDVTASHGCTVGSLDANELFYLRSRGLSEEDARELLQYAFAEVIIDEISDDQIRAKVEVEFLGELKQGALITELKDSVDV